MDAHNNVVDGCGHKIKMAQLRFRVARKQVSHLRREDDRSRSVAVVTLGTVALLWLGEPSCGMLFPPTTCAAYLNASSLGPSRFWDGYLRMALHPIRDERKYLYTVSVLQPPRSLRTNAIVQPHLRFTLQLGG
jgi:hypothetical protein